MGTLAQEGPRKGNLVSQFRTRLSNSVFGLAIKSTRWNRKHELIVIEAYEAGQKTDPLAKDAATLLAPMIPAVRLKPALLGAAG